MDRLDELESQSVYILREAYNRIEPMAMLWSLGKDSNVMLWLARKAFFGHVPFPVMHVDTGKKFKEMYEFRDRYAAEWKLDFLREECPPIEEMDESLPPAARSAARKTEGLRNAIEKHQVQGADCRYPARRAGNPRQGARVQPARRDGPMGLPRSAAGVLGPI